MLPLVPQLRPDGVLAAASQECTKCGVIKPHTDFNRDKTKADGLQFRCKGCVHDYMRRRRRSEAGQKRRQMDDADRAIAADNLAVLAQVRPAVWNNPSDIYAL